MARKKMLVVATSAMAAHAMVTPKDLAQVPEGKRELWDIVEDRYTPPCGFCFSYHNFEDGILGPMEVPPELKEGERLCLKVTADSVDGLFAPDHRACYKMTGDSCPDDAAMCKWDGMAECGCTHYKDGAHPSSTKDQALCVTNFNLERAAQQNLRPPVLPRGRRLTEYVEPIGGWAVPGVPESGPKSAPVAICELPKHGYEERFGLTVPNCHHPSMACIQPTTFIPMEWAWTPHYCDVISNIDTQALFAVVDYPEFIDSIYLPDLINSFDWITVGYTLGINAFLRGFTLVDWGSIIDAADPCAIITAIHPPLHNDQTGELVLGTTSLLSLDLQSTYQDLNCGDAGEGVVDTDFALVGIDISGLAFAVDWGQVWNAFQWNEILTAYINAFFGGLADAVDVPSLIGAIDWLEFLDALNIDATLDSIDYVYVSEELDLKHLWHSINPEELLGFLDVPGVKLRAILDNIDFETIFFATSVRMVLGAIDVPTILDVGFDWSVFGNSISGELQMMPEGLVPLLAAVWNLVVSEVDVQELLSALLGQGVDLELLRVFSDTVTPATLLGWSPEDIDWDEILSFDWGEAFNQDAWDQFLFRNTGADVDTWWFRVLDQIGAPVGEPPGTYADVSNTWRSPEEGAPAFGAVAAGATLDTYVITKALAFVIFALPELFPGEVDVVDIAASIVDSLDICLLVERIDWVSLWGSLNLRKIVKKTSPSWDEFIELEGPDTYGLPREGEYKEDTPPGFSYWPLATSASKPLVEPAPGEGWWEILFFGEGDIGRRSRRLGKKAITKVQHAEFSIGQAVIDAATTPRAIEAEKKMVKAVLDKEKKEHNLKKAKDKIDKERMDKLRHTLTGVYDALRLRRIALRSGAKRPTAGRKLGEASAARAGADKDKPADGMLGRAAAWAKKTHVRASIASALGAEKKVESRWNHFELA